MMTHTIVPKKAESRKKVSTLEAGWEVEGKPGTLVERSGHW